MSALTCLELLLRRLGSLPAQLDAALASFDVSLPRDAGRVLVTGAGMSEGPARLMAALLAEAGQPGAFVPMSEFVTETPPRDGDTLVVFSQGLSPNARFPLIHLPSFRHAFLITSVRPDPEAPAGDARRAAAEAERNGARVVCVPPEDESGLLLRVVGPAVAALAGALLALPHARAQLASVPSLYAEALAAPAEPLFIGGRSAPIALVASGRYANACHGLAWKLLEGLLLPAPPVWDVLQVAHGPLQSFYEREQIVIALERKDAREGPLLECLAQTLVPSRHRLLRVPSRSPGALAWFEHDARLDALLLATLRARPIDLAAWPGRRADKFLYALAPAS